jgi:GTP-binding protein LepA
MQVIGGKISENKRISTFASVKESKEIDNRVDFSVQEIGVLTPEQLRTTALHTGQVGYVICGMRSTKQARIGDTMYIPSEWKKGETILPLTGYESAKSMLFASIFPVDSNELEALFMAVDKLCLNDNSLNVARDQSSSLGSGLRIGFLGFLHMEVFNQRLTDEFNLQIVMTAPSVPYKIEYEDGTEETISSVSDWPQPKLKSNFKVYEPMVKVTLLTPKEYYGDMMDIIKDRRGSEVEVQYLDDDQVLLTSIIPWQEVVIDMNDVIKHNSSGYASFNYEDAGNTIADLVMCEIAVNGEACDALSFISHTTKATINGRKLAIKLKDILDRQQFEIVIQARIGLKVLARERIAPYRKDVLARSGKTVGGGDITRKMKLLKKQKEGKKRSKMVGKVEITQAAFFSVLQR